MLGGAQNAKCIPGNEPECAVAGGGRAGEWGGCGAECGVDGAVCGDGGEAGWRRDVWRAFVCGVRGGDGGRDDGVDGCGEVGGDERCGGCGGVQSGRVRYFGGDGGCARCDGEDGVCDGDGVCGEWGECAACVPVGEWGRELDEHLQQPAGCAGECAAGGPERREYGVCGDGHGSICNYFGDNLRDGGLLERVWDGIAECAGGGAAGGGGDGDGRWAIWRAACGDVWAGDMGDSAADGGERGGRRR